MDEVDKLDRAIVNIEAAVLNVQLAERAVLEFHRRCDPQVLSRQGLQKLLMVIVETYADSMAEFGRLKNG